ncbi:MAG: hypothetical protein NBV68_03335 [Erythrobacter sp.]|uniref:hypothetical protein n=1 Tax=Erythrobacter sp. TaxID=1042 RepID=UPI0025F16192|nr:hypothetical protein [Erythrobacter sp.]MCL9998391.1 hypothetical protein [Erythrobacter sp.]
MPHMPDDDEGEIRFSLTELALGLAAAVMIAPGVIWWIGKLVEIARITLEVFR